MSLPEDITRFLSIMQRSSLLTHFFIMTVNELASMLSKIGKLKAVEVQRDIDGYVILIEGSAGNLRVKVTIEIEGAVSKEGG